MVTEGYKKWAQEKVENKEIKEIGEAPRLLKSAIAMDAKEDMVAFLSDEAEDTLSTILNKS